MNLRIILACALACSSIGFFACAEPNDLFTRFEKESEAAWQTLESKLKVGTFVSRTESKNQSGVYRQYNCRFLRNGRHRLIIEETISGNKNKHEAVGINGDYAFTLRCNSEKQWALIGLNDLSVESDETIQGYDEWLKRHEWLVKSHFLMVGVEPFNKMVAKPYFKILGNRELEIDGREHLEISFEYPHPVDERVPFLNAPIACDGGTVILDPENNWMVKGYEIYFAEGDSQVRSLVRISTSDNGKLCKLVEKVQKTIVDGQELFTESTVFDKWDERPPQLNEFRISAFELEEPAQYQNSVPSYLIVGLLAVGTTMLGLFILGKTKRKR